MDNIQECLYLVDGDGQSGKTATERSLGRKLSIFSLTAHDIFILNTPIISGEESAAPTPTQLVLFASTSIKYQSGAR